MKQLLVLCLIMLAVAARAATPNCAAISDRDARLDCYDRANAPLEPAPPDSTPSTDESLASEVILPVTPTPQPSGTEAVVTLKPVDQEAIPESWIKGIFSRTEKAVVNATIVEVFSEDKQRMAFRLDNNEVWIQSSPRNLPISKGMPVTIKQGLSGGFVLRTRDGVSTRVSRHTDA